MLVVFCESYGILEWENAFGFVSGCKSTLLKHHEIYKGNSKKYKGKMRNQDILVFGPKNNCVECVRWWAAFLRSQRFFWHPYWHTYIWCMSEHHTCQICHIWHIWHIWHTWHMSYDMHTYVIMGVKRSVRTPGIQPTILYILQNCVTLDTSSLAIKWPTVAENTLLLNLWKKNKLII